MSPYQLKFATKNLAAVILMSVSLFACTEKADTGEKVSGQNPVEGTWKLLSGTLIEKGDTTVTEYAGNVSFIKILNGTHFAFLHHDLKKGKDSTAVFSSGGGTYSLKDSVYTEHLEYCSAREWEGNDFPFTIEIKNDTLIQTGIEKVESANVNRLNIEKYVRIK